MTFIRKVRRAISKAMHGERGAGLVEYALVVALIAVVAIGSIALVGERTLTEYECASQEIDTPGIRRVVQDKIKNDAVLLKFEKKFATDCL